MSGRLRVQLKSAEILFSEAHAETISRTRRTCVWAALPSAVHWKNSHSQSQAVAWPLRNFNFDEHCFKRLTISFEGRSEVVTVLDAVCLYPPPSANG